jgi:hypothetical protein
MMRTHQFRFAWLVGQALIVAGLSLPALGAEPASGNKAPAPLRSAELAIGGVAIGDTASKVERTLGSPSSERYIGDYIDREYVYPHMVVGFGGRMVLALETSESTACTSRGLCPGDTLAKLRALYGEPVVADRETGRFLEIYTNDGGTCWFKITPDDERVERVAVVCMP